jgi:sortase A
MTYVYLKQAAPPSRKLLRLKLKMPQKRVLAIILFVLGITTLSSAIVPIISFSISESSRLIQIISPLSNKFYNQSTILGQSEVDYTQLSNWFVEKDNPNTNPTNTDQPQTYTISIPKLKIDKAVVMVGGDDLKKNLVQYPNTANPGQLGNTVIFGHSVLPQFFNPKSYLTIFSTLFKLKQADEILINFDGIDYKYIVEQMYEVEPTDLSVLEPRLDGRYLTIITCSPPGTYLRRLIVKAKIVDI